MAGCFPDIVDALDKLMLSRRKQYPCHVNRASQIGDDCERRLVYMRTAWEQAKQPDIGLQYIFEVGNTLETPVVRMLQDAGFEVSRQQESFLYRSKGKVLVSGHIDGVISKGDFRGLLEIKTMSPWIWEKVTYVEDFERYPWTRKYPPQLNLYMLGTEIEYGIWVLINKSTGRIKTIPTRLDYELVEKAIQKAERINNHVDNGTLPDCLEPTIKNGEICEKCEFNHICNPPIFREGLELIIDQELIEKVNRMHELKPEAQEYKSLYDEMKTQLRGRAKVVIGDYLYMGKFNDKGDRWTGKFTPLDQIKIKK